MRTTRKRDRRGVLILIILSMLVLFILVAVAFVVTAGQHRTAAKAASRAQLTGNSPQQQLDQALRQLLRGSTNASSVFKDNSLLDDMYANGEDGTLSNSPVVVNGSGGQLLQLTSNDLGAGQAQAYGGRVLTFTSGPAKNVSTRILSSNVSGGMHTLVVLAPISNNLPTNGDKFFINGRAFSGENGNEDYDAVDQFNPHLAAIIPGVALNDTPQVIPSFDRTQSGGASARAFGNVNPAWSSTNTHPWDVDNDGDGIFDSIWIDAGFPVQTAPDGQLYKALVAVLCIDLDGRLNLNAHGNLSHLAARPNAADLAGGATTYDVPRGEGYGPPEISLEPVLVDPSDSSKNYYANFLQGSGGFAGRYGANQLPGLGGATDSTSLIRLFEYPAQYVTNANDFTTGILTSFGAPSNLKGNLAFGLEHRGMPAYDGVNFDQLTDNPYEIHLSSHSRSGDDEPLGLDELEVMLRQFDRDAAGLPMRLLGLSSPEWMRGRRHEVTTHSFDLPVYSGNLRQMLITKSTDLTAVPSVVAPELLMGLRMNLNRPFGNGRDNNGDNVVDNSEEAGASEKVWASVNKPTAGYPATGVTMDRDNDGVIDNEGEQSRQIYARQLFTLMLLIANPTDPADIRELAQWAVNVVDFRDADSIMTRFDYDPSPFDGWTPDGTNVVWGCERPELLITETLAFHDRRTEDLDNADTGDPEKPDTKTSAPMDADEDFDQREMPQGSGFIELYNPWPRTGYSKYPGELYDATLTGVDLQRTAPGGAPVWRIIVTDNASDPDDPDSGFTDADIERWIYFTGAGGAGAANQVFRPHPDAIGDIEPLRPGRYAVVGSAGEADAGVYTTYIGRRNDGGPENTTRRILLNPGGTPGVKVLNDGTNASPASLPFNVVAVPLDRFSFTEPTDGSYEMAPGYDAATRTYNPPLDEPIDKGNADLWKDGVTTDYRTIHLQRLANPLATYDGTYNPYRTIDTMTVSLFAFDGFDSPTGDAKPPGDHAKFTTHQRGDNSAGEYNLWQREPSADASGAGSPGAGDHHFDFNLTHTLGHLNAKYGPTPSAIPADPGAPAQPFPWLVWNNRPFVSHFELLQVPKSRSSQLTAEFTLANNGEFGHLYDIPGLAYQLFDYVHVPSRFADAQINFNPANFSTSTPGPYPFRAPHNSLSRFRDPGRVNINTIYSKRVWDGIMHIASSSMVAHSGPSWAELVTSRRGVSSEGATASDNILTAPPAGETSFIPKPFRSFGNNPIDDTLMRSNFTESGPLFGPPSSSGAYNNPQRNSYFQYQAVQRMGNLVTTRSNVYAVWITLGYFKTDAAGGWPGGQGVELGADTGAVKRHRAFYIIDRTIPVGFEAGKDHNSQDAVLLRSFIE